MCSAVDDGPFDPTGFPIRTSTDPGLFGGSPWLFAAFHVLLRRQTPRHPPYALVRLTIASLDSRIPPDVRRRPSSTFEHIGDARIASVFTAISCSFDIRRHRPNRKSTVQIFIPRRINLLPHRSESLPIDAVSHHMPWGHVMCSAATQTAFASRLCVYHPLHFSKNRVHRNPDRAPPLHRRASMGTTGSPRAVLRGARGGCPLLL